MKTDLPAASGWSIGTVPDASPYVFAMVQSGSVEILFNARGPAVEEYPALANMPIGGTLTLWYVITFAERAE